MTEKRRRVDDYLLAKAFRGLDDLYTLIYPSNIYIHIYAYTRIYNQKLTKLYQINEKKQNENICLFQI